MFGDFCQKMLNKFLEKNPDWATFLGLHEPYDYLLPNGSTQTLVENLQLMEESIKRLNETMRKEELNEDNKINWDVIEKAHEHFRFSFYERRMHELNPDAFEEIAGLIYTMFTRNYAPMEKRVDAIAARIEKAPRFLREFRSRFEDSQPVRLWTEMAIDTAQNIGGLLRFIVQATKGKVPAETHKRLEKAIESFQPAFKRHVEWLNSLLPRAKEEWALGVDKFEKLLRIRELGMTSNEIYELGAKYLRELKAERERLARQIAHGKSTEEVVKMIESNAPKTFEEALEFTRKTVEEARRFVQEKNIATVYSEDILLVEETPAYLTPVIPFAALITPAKFDKPQIGNYIVTRPKDPTNLGKHLNYARITNTAVHEAFPGHFLQTAVSNRGNFVHQLAHGTETIEGWAHYCEEMMIEKGFATDPETRLMQINKMIWRAVRVIIDVRLSRGEMAFERAIELLVEEAGISRDAAKAEVKRYTQTPGYQLSYLLGKHLILKLKEEVKQKMGDRFDEKLFHDTITANGYLPVSMLRRILDRKARKPQSS